MKGQEPEEMNGVPPSFMTAEFFTPDGERYNFEQVVINTGMFIELVNESGDKMILRFWDIRQSEREYPLDQKEASRYVNETIPNVANGKRTYVRNPLVQAGAVIGNALRRLRTRNP